MDFIVLRRWTGVINGRLVTLEQGATIDQTHYDVPALKAAGLRVVAFSVALAALVAQDDGQPGDGVAAAVVDAGDNAAALAARVSAVAVPVFAGGAVAILDTQHFTTNGDAGAAATAGVDEESESTAGLVGTLTGISWNKNSAAADTVVSVKVNGSIVEAVTLSLGASGFLALAAGTAITALSRVSVEKTSGTAPGAMTVKVLAGF